MDDQLQALRNSPEFAEEKLVAAVQSLLLRLLEERGMNRADLAAKMGVTRARVSQIFSDNQNFTLRMVARAFHALNEDISIVCQNEMEHKSADRYSDGQVSMLDQVSEISHGFEWIDDVIGNGWQEILHSSARPALISKLIAAHAATADQPVRARNAEREERGDKLLNDWKSQSGGGTVVSLFGESEVANG